MKGQLKAPLKPLDKILPVSWRSSTGGRNPALMMPRGTGFSYENLQQFKTLSRKAQHLNGISVCHARWEIFSESLQIEPNLNRNYTFPIDLAHQTAKYQSKMCNYDLVCQIGRKSVIKIRTLFNLTTFNIIYLNDTHREIEIWFLLN